MLHLTLTLTLDAWRSAWRSVCLYLKWDSVWTQLEAMLFSLSLQNKQTLTHCKSETQCIWIQFSCEWFKNETFTEWNLKKIDAKTTKRHLSWVSTVRSCPCFLVNKFEHVRDLGWDFVKGVGAGVGRDGAGRGGAGRGGAGRGGAL